MKTQILGIGLWLSMAAASFAQIGGTVYGVYPEGVMINRGGYYSLVPNQHATFSIGGLNATWSSLQPGQVVNAVLPPAYYPGVQRIADPYAWKMKYHPDHPHGAPPGQVKNSYSGKGNAKSNGNGNGKGKGKGK